MWAEWYRQLAERAVPPLRQLPREFWHYRVGSIEVADLTTCERLARVGLHPPRPGRVTWRPYQEIGEALWREGWRGLLAPSAARPRGMILCLFVGNAASAPAEPLPPPLVVSEPPVPPTGMRT